MSVVEPSPSAHHPQDGSDERVEATDVDHDAEERDGGE
jgi:hypothetical protein